MASYIRFVEEPNEGRKTKRFVIENRKSGAELAFVEFYPKWRQYVVEFREECVFSDGCLKEIQEFVARQNAEWRCSLPKGGGQVADP